MFPFFESESAEGLWPQLIKAFKEEREASERRGVGLVEGRGGQTTELLHAVIHLNNPRRRWMYPREPAMNPAFALAEIVWILAGRQDSAFVNYWNPKLSEFAGDGPTYYGAYGWRLRHEHGFDQLKRAYEVLQASPQSRQVVLDIWKPSLDLPSQTGAPLAKDIPCNICSLLKVRDGQLHWTQIMRSNDLILGLPHNLVQWTTVQEVLAGWLGLEVGSYTHLSDSLHVYESDWSIVEAFSPRGSATEVPINDDNLALPLDEFTSTLDAVEARAQGMIEPNLTSQALEELGHLENCATAYQNILFILAADTARRHKWQAQADDLAAKCTNPGLRFLWNRWNLRMSNLD